MLKVSYERELMVEFQEPSSSASANFLLDALGGKQTELCLESSIPDGAKVILRHQGFCVIEKKSITEELAARGYDLSTLTMSIQKNV